MKELRIPRAKTPEEVGVSGKAVEAFLNEIEENRVNIHSFMILRHGKVAAECWRAPFSPETPHALYSVSKTFTGAAVGIAIGEGLLSMDDKVKDFFPEYTAHLKDPKLDRLLVRHLVTMTSGKNPSVLDNKSKGHWVESFFRFPWKSAPGEEFQYVSENTYMLCAILVKVTGGSVRDFLQPRLFSPMGIAYPQWETDENGVEAGGWGLYLTTEDVAKLMLCLHQGGAWEGRQLIPADYVKEMTSFGSDGAPENTAPNIKAGYGYCVWRNEAVNGYRADGMFSQFGIVFQDYDAIIVLNAGIPMEQHCRDLIWKYFPAGFLDENAPAPETAVPGLEKRLREAKIESPCPPSTSPMAEYIENRPIHFRKKLFLNLIGFPMSMLPLAVTFMATERGGNIDDVTFRFTEGALTMTWREGRHINTVKAGMDGRYCYGNMTLGGVTYKVCCTAEWREKDRLFVSVRPIETIGKRTLDFSFRLNGKVVMTPSGDPSVPVICEYLCDIARDLTENPVLLGGLRKIIRLLPPIVEPKHYGKLQ